MPKIIKKSSYRTTRMRHYWIVREEVVPGVWFWRAEFRFKRDATRWALDHLESFKVVRGEVV